jgi:hypothetical protein
MPKYLLFSLLLLCACQSNSETSNPQGSGTPVPATAATAPAVAVPGGETQQSTTDPQAKAMLINAQNLLNQKYPNANIQLSELSSYTTQVVAGSNHRLQASYSNGDGKKGIVKVTIFQDLNGAISLATDDYPGV